MKFDLRFLSGKPGTSDGVAGDEGQIVVDSMHGKYYQANQKYGVFSSSTTPLGLAIPVYTTVTPLGNVLWNPQGSGVKAVLAKYNAARASGTAGFFAIGLMARNGVGSVIATGAQVTAFAETTPINGKLGLVNSIAGSGGGPTSRVKSSRAGTCTVTAAVAGEWIETLGATGVEADATTNGISLINHDFDGRIEVYPGTMVWLAATLASVALYASTIGWYEVAI
jgi:hypothetical protein